jgi:hypothetical protein
MATSPVREEVVEEMDVGSADDEAQRSKEVNGKGEAYTGATLPRHTHRA